MTKIKLKRLKSFEIRTAPWLGGRNIFLTKARSGKDALLNLINHSSDYKDILSDTYSNNMTISIIHHKIRRGKNK